MQGRLRAIEKARTNGPGFLIFSKGFPQSADHLDALRGCRVSLRETEHVGSAETLERLRTVCVFCTLRCRMSRPFMSVNTSWPCPSVHLNVQQIVGRVGEHRPHDVVVQAIHGIDHKIYGTDAACAVDGKDGVVAGKQAVHAYAVRECLLAFTFKPGVGVGSTPPVTVAVAEPFPKPPSVVVSTETSRNSHRSKSYKVHGS